MFHDLMSYMYSNFKINCFFDLPENSMPQRSIGDANKELESTSSNRTFTQYQSSPKASPQKVLMKSRCTGNIYALAENKSTIVRLQIMLFNIQRTLRFSMQIWPLKKLGRVGLAMYNSRKR